MKPFREHILTRLREIAATFAWLLHPLRAYDAAHDYATPEDVAIEDRRQLGDTTWIIRVYDDQPIAEGRKYAAYRRVVLMRDGKQVREFLYPSYRIWTLLAHWTEGLADTTDEKDPNA